MTSPMFSDGAVRLRVLGDHAAAHGAAIQPAVHRGILPRRAAGRRGRVPDSWRAGARGAAPDADSAPLPRKASRAAIDAPATLRCAPGAVLPLRIMVRNEGTEHMADHGRRGRPLRDPPRDPLAGTVRMDAAVRRCPHGAGTRPCAGRVHGDRHQPRSPSQTGNLHPRVRHGAGVGRWFAQAGSRRARTRVHVDPALAPGEVQGLPPRIEMYGIPRRRDRGVDCALAAASCWPSTTTARRDRLDELSLHRRGR